MILTNLFLIINFKPSLSHENTLSTIEVHPPTKVYRCHKRATSVHSKPIVKPTEVISIEKVTIPTNYPINNEHCNTIDDQVCDKNSNYFFECVPGNKWLHRSCSEGTKCVQMEKRIKQVHIE